MEPGRNVSIGRDAKGTIIATGDGNHFYVFLDGEEPDAELLHRIENQELSPEEVGAADPLPHLTLRIRSQKSSTGAWTITPLLPTQQRQADGSFLLPGSTRPWNAPWQRSADFGRHLDSFWKLTAHALRNEQERLPLQAAALALGEALGQALLPQEVEHLRTVDLADGPPPFLVIDSEDDLILALPWELIHLEGTWPILAGRLDLARSIPASGSPQLEPPTKAISLLVSVSAPQGSGLNYEEESYRIARALHHHAEVTINEMGELEDLVAGLAQEPPPIGVHFSGHGAGYLLRGRGDDSALRSSHRGRLEDTVFHDPSREKLLDKAQNVTIRDFLGEGCHNDFERDVVEEGLNVCVEYDAEALFM